MVHFFYIAVFIILYSIFLWEMNEMREDIETLRKEYAKLIGDIYGSNQEILNEWEDTIHSNQKILSEWGDTLDRFNYFQKELLRYVKGG